MKGSSAMSLRNRLKPSATIPMAGRSSSSTVKELRPKRRRVASKQHQQFDTPDKSWEPNRLGEFACAEQKRLKLYDRKMAVHALRLGHALTFAHEKLPYGEWGKFLKKFKLSEATDWRARKLFEVAKTEQAVKGLGLMQAYKAFGINKGQKKPKPSSEEQAAPPKEPKSISKSLSQVVMWLDGLIDEAGFADWKKESKEHCLGLIDEAHSILNKISGEVSRD